MKKLYTVICLIVCVAIYSGCGKKPVAENNQKDYIIGVVTKSRDSEYWMSVVSGMEKAAGDMKVTVLVVSPDTETDNELQKKMINDLLEKGIDALAVSPIDSYDFEEYVTKAKEKGIPVFSYDTQIVDSDIPYIGIDNEKAGKELAEYMAGQLKERGRVGIISGDLKQTAHEQRIKGFRKYIEENTEIEIAFIESGYSNLQMSEQEITRLIGENPDITGIFATSAVTALGIMEYMKGQPVTIVTVDAQEDALEAVTNGGIAALASQSGYEIGYETIRYIVNEKNKGNQELQKILKVEVITSKNVKEYEN